MTRSNPPTLYDEDFFAWTQQQAAALRRATGLGQDIDIEHVAEEIEDLGKREIREVNSFLRRLLEHLLKIDAYPSSRDAGHWRGEVLMFASSALDAFTPSMRQLVDLDAAWRRSATLARRQLKEMAVEYEPPAECPFTLDDLLTDDLDLDAALDKLAAARHPPMAPHIA